MSATAHAWAVVWEDGGMFLTDSEERARDYMDSARAHHPGRARLALLTESDDLTTRYFAAEVADRWRQECVQLRDSLRPAAVVVAIEPRGPDGHGVNWLAGKRPKPGDLLYARAATTGIETKPGAPTFEGADAGNLA